MWAPRGPAATAVSRDPWGPQGPAPRAAEWSMGNQQATAPLGADRESASNSFLLQVYEMLGALTRGSSHNSMGSFTGQSPGEKLMCLLQSLAEPYLYNNAGGAGQAFGAPGQGMGSQGPSATQYHGSHHMPGFASQHQPEQFNWENMLAALSQYPNGQALFQALQPLFSGQVAGTDRSLNPSLQPYRAPETQAGAYGPDMPWHGVGSAVTPASYQPFQQGTAEYGPYRADVGHVAPPPAAGGSASLQDMCLQLLQMFCSRMGLSTDGLHTGHQEQPRASGQHAKPWYPGAGLSAQPHGASGRHMWQPSVTVCQRLAPCSACWHVLRSARRLVW